MHDQKNGCPATQLELPGVLPHFRMLPTVRRCYRLSGEVCSSSNLLRAQAHRRSHPLVGRSAIRVFVAVPVESFRLLRLRVHFRGSRCQDVTIAIRSFADGLSPDDLSVLLVPPEVVGEAEWTED